MQAEEWFTVSCLRSMHTTGIKVVELKEGSLNGEMKVEKEFFAPNWFLHAGSIVTFADTLAGYATVAHLPEKAFSFTTLELKSNFIGAIREGKLLGECLPVHLGRTTQVWSVTIKNAATKKNIALFTCTQLVLYKNA